MTIVDHVLSALLAFWPALVIALLLLGALKLIGGLAARRRSHSDYKRTLIPQLLMVLTTMLGLLVTITVLPVSDATRGQILGLLGVVFTGIIALSSTTFVTNALAGLMLRLIKNYKSGDFIRIKAHFGRITERGLFHTEIQTEDRNLTTFPNLYLVTNPITVLRSSGTIVSASLSLGYDIPRQQVERHLVEAASQSGLEEPFVQIVDLGDFAITYKISGFLTETKHLLAARSNLRRSVLDTLHQAGIEIVSPSFMTQRRLSADAPVIPTRPAAAPVTGGKGAKLPERVMFDKAETAERIERWREKLAMLNDKLDSLGKNTDARAVEARSKIMVAISQVESKITSFDQLLSEDEEIKKA